MPDLVPMNKFASFCLTEPGSGSDAQAMITSARLDGEYYIINGSKCFISNGSISDIYLLMYRTGPKEVSTIIVDNGTKGLGFGRSEQKI
jgi:isobutyryl-CoA dehydrogenase